MDVSSGRFHLVCNYWPSADVFFSSVFLSLCPAGTPFIIKVSYFSFFFFPAIETHNSRLFDEMVSSRRFTLAAYYFKLRVMGLTSVLFCIESGWPCCKVLHAWLICDRPAR